EQAITHVARTRVIAQAQAAAESNGGLATIPALGIQGTVPAEAVVGNNGARVRTAHGTPTIVLVAAAAANSGDLVRTTVPGTTEIAHGTMVTDPAAAIHGRTATTLESSTAQTTAITRSTISTTMCSIIR